MKDELKQQPIIFSQQDNNNPSHLKAAEEELAYSISTILRITEFDSRCLDKYSTQVYQANEVTSMQQRVYEKSKYMVDRFLQLSNIEIIEFVDIKANFRDSDLELLDLLIRANEDRIRHCNIEQTACAIPLVHRRVKHAPIFS